MSAKRPNILFIMADQFRSDIMSCAGGPAHTPALDMLAAEGIRFSNCATVAPLCIPARISLFTGKYPHTTRAWDNASFVLSPHANIWSKQFRDLGYATSLFGKTHLHGSKCDFIAREDYLHGYGFDTVNEITGPHASCESRTYMTDLWKEKGYFDRQFCVSSTLFHFSFCISAHRFVHRQIEGNYKVIFTLFGNI